jgi:hypothetical protein
LANVQKAIIVFDDGTTEEYSSFIGEFVDTDTDMYRGIVSNFSDAQMALSMNRMNLRYKQLLEKKFSLREDDIIGK